MVIASAFSCRRVFEPVSNRNFAYIYNPSLTDIHPEVKLYRVSKDSLRVFIRIPVSEIGFPEIIKREDQKSGIKVRYFMIDSVNSQTFRDTGSFVFRLSQLPATNYWQVAFGCKLPDQSVQWIEIETQDIFSELYNQQVLRILPFNTSNPNRYMMYYNNPEYPQLSNTIKEDDTIRVKHFSESDSLWVFHLSQNKKDSLPYDTLFKIACDQPVHFSKSGIYLIHADSSFTGGLRIVKKGKYFPAIREIEPMLPPIRLLVNDNEWRELSELPPKKAVDTFWMVAGGEAEQARSLIRLFYNRVQLANHKFSGTSEGWQTHMGRLLSIVGLPDEVEFADTGETWYYFINKNDRLQVPFEYNDSTTGYYLKRNDSLLNSFYYYHINSWRQGQR